MNNMRRGFTMIELIFVIVIIGILASVAIPKLMATRDDAQVTKSLADLATCVSNTGAMATSKRAPTDKDMKELPACIKVTELKVFTVSFASATKTLTVGKGSNNAAWAATAKTLAKDVKNGGLIGDHLFGGQGIENE